MNISTQPVRRPVRRGDVYVPGRHSGPRFKAIWSGARMFTGAFLCRDTGTAARYGACGADKASHVPTMAVAAVADAVR